MSAYTGWRPGQIRPFRFISPCSFFWLFHLQFPYPPAALSAREVFTSSLCRFVSPDDSFFQESPPLEFFWWSLWGWVWFDILKCKPRLSSLFVQNIIPLRFFFSQKNPMNFPLAWLMRDDLDATKCFQPKTPGVISFESG